MYIYIYIHIQGQTLEICYSLLEVANMDFLEKEALIAWISGDSEPHRDGKPAVYIIMGIYGI